MHRYNEYSKDCIELLCRVHYSCGKYFPIMFQSNLVYASRSGLHQSIALSRDHAQARLTFSSLRDVFLVSKTSLLVQHFAHFAVAKCPVPLDIITKTRRQVFLTVVSRLLHLRIIIWLFCYMR